MSYQTKVTADLSKLDGILKDLGGQYVARVGILGANAGAAHDTDSPITNAEIGLIHEFGSATNNIPARSFLRMPLETKQDELVQVMDAKVVKAAIEAGDIPKAFKILGIAAQDIVKQAFQTSGFGQWAANAPYTIARKGSSKPLINTGFLMAAISSDVKKKGEI